MKKRIVLFTALSGLAYLTLTSESGGPALSSNNRTGAQGSTNNCGGSGCHGGAGATTVTIVVDSGTTPVSRYVPGMTYKVIVAGGNTSLLAKYGFQFAAVSGPSTAQVQAGTFSSLPTGTADHSFSGLHFIEHTVALTAAIPGAYADTFMWTAPAVGVGNITMYGTINAVNGNGSADAADVSGNASKVLTQIPGAGVQDVFAGAEINAFPNPVSSMLNLELNNAKAGDYTVHVFDISGKVMNTQTVSISGSSHTATINTNGWVAGVYNVVVARDGATHTSTVVKQ